MVGFLEYSRALEHFDTLLQQLSQEELEIVDQMVAEQPQYTVYTNLSRQLQRAPSSLADASETETARTGLRALMALARIELAAMLATFTDVQDPYGIVAPSQFELPVYREMLLDGARAHYWGLVNDPNLRTVVKLSPQNHQVLSYSRRLVLARSMLRAALKLNLDRFSPVQMREIASWSEGLDSLQRGFYDKFQRFLAGFSQTSTSQTYAEAEYVNACGALLRAEAREIQRGTATITNYSGNRAGNQ